MKESQKMAALQKQLSKMDEQLTVDVSVIRDDIEIASYAYNDARLLPDVIDNVMATVGSDAIDNVMANCW